MRMRSAYVYINMYAVPLSGGREANEPNRQIHTVRIHLANNIQYIIYRTCWMRVKASIPGWKTAPVASAYIRAI